MTKKNFDFDKEMNAFMKPIQINVILIDPAVGSKAHRVECVHEYHCWLGDVCGIPTGRKMRKRGDLC